MIDSEIITQFSIHQKQNFDLEFAMRTRRQTIYIVTAVNFLMLLMELIVDFNTGNPMLLGTFLILNSILAILVRYSSNTYWYGQAMVFLFFLLIQLHFFSNPKFFHTLIYWMPLIPMLSIFLASLRASLIWLLITLIAVFVNAYFGYVTIGEKYYIEARYIAFAIGGIIFLLANYMSYIMMYRLIGQYYLDQQKKREEANSLNKQLNHVKLDLEEKVAGQVADVKEKNKQIEKYAFMNSHIVRAPLANILGAVNLYNATDDPTSKEELFELIDQSAQKLDEVIQNVSKDLYIDNK
ncbi:histidine kinase [Reichenbachiella versicolor]|uniref:hypothetical protein n=1 Tax=Reichenbachiella versicolor TaxID=1821036 RepID=UPI0013A55B32|nr:hypothetical protein [Reichenbachiella versicolor]